MNDLTIIGLQSLVASLRHQLRIVTSERDRLKREGSKPRPRTKPLIAIGTTKDGATVTGHDQGLCVLKCGCGAIFRRGREALVSKVPWRCMTCYKDAARQITVEQMK